MKKILMAAVVLLCFALALTLTQISCSKSSAQTTGSTTPTPIGLVLYEANNIGTVSGTDSVTYYLCNYDGSNNHQINITGLPSGYLLNNGAKLSPDGKTLFFVAYSQTIQNNFAISQSFLYSANIDGSNLKQLFQIPGNSGALVDGGY
jgi:hypothetical protein